jgi:hypothetical protein
MNSRKEERGFRLAQHVVDTLKKHVQFYGYHRTAKSAGVAAETLARACAGMPLNLASIKRLDEYVRTHS